MPPKTISLKFLVQKFRNLGYSGSFSGGRHQFMVKGTQKIHIPNPHGTREIHISLLKEILRQAEISVKDLERA